jgi:intracellular multiplication protein IcmK
MKSPYPALFAFLIGFAIPALAEPPAEQGAPGSNAATPESAIPLTPEMIRELGRRFGDAERAKEEAVTPAALPLSRKINVAMAAGQAVSIVDTVKGFTSALSFFDSTGKPWPIAWDTNSNPAAVTGTNCTASASPGGPSATAAGFFVCTPVKGSNVLEITPVSLQPRGGLVVTLEGAEKPVVFLLVAGGGRYDADLTVAVGGRGPNAKPELVQHLNRPDTGAPFLTAMLDGVPPADAVPLSVTGVSPDELRAWHFRDRIYVRTRYPLLSPEWTDSEAGPGGVTVYAVPPTPVILLSADGRTIAAHIKED